MKTERKILVYGKEHTFLEKETGLLFRNSTLKNTAPLHTHTFHEIFIVAQGSAWHFINNAVTLVQKGDMVFIRPNDTHCYDFYHSDDFRIVNVGFSSVYYDSIKSFLDNDPTFKILDTLSEAPVIHLKTDQLSFIEKNFIQIGEKMKETSPRKKSSAVSFAKSILAFIFSEHFLNQNLIESDPAGKNISRRDWFEELIIQMRKIENFCQGLSKMLKLAGCSKNHLCRLFRTKMNCSPTAFINKQRIIYAAYLLTCTDDNMISICEQCGFGNLSHFYRLFKIENGLSPLQYRKETALREK